MDKISVIVPVFKVAKYLPRCLDSIIHQTYSNLEIILVDDGSPDCSGEICDWYAGTDPRIFVVHQKNAGLSAARNTGLEACTGDYISFVDSDDWIAPTMLETLHTICVQYRTDIAECSYCNVLPDRQHQETGCTGALSFYDPIEAIRQLHMWKAFRSVVWNKLYHTDTIGTLRFAVGRTNEDEFFTWRCILNARRLASVDVSMYYYNRTRSDSITTVASENRLDGLDAFEERIEFFWNNEKLTTLTESINNAYLSTAEKILSWCLQNNIMTKRTIQLAGKAKARMCIIQENNMPVQLDLLEKLEVLLQHPEFDDLMTGGKI